MNILSVVILLTSFFNLFLGLFIFFKRKKNYAFSAFCFLTAIWVFSNFVLVEKPSIFYLKTTYALGSVALTSACFWALSIASEKITKKKIFFLILLGLIFFSWSYLTPIENSHNNHLYSMGLEVEKGGMFFSAYTVFVALLFGFILFFLIRKYRKNKDAKIGYVLLGASLQVITIISLTFILPLFGFHKLSALDSPSSLFFVFFSFLAIAKYNLLNLKVVLTEILVFAAGIILLTLPFAVKEPQLKVLTLALFFVFSCFGYLLIRTAKREVKRKEILETEVRKRTQELQKAKTEAEETSQKLRKRNEELERFYKLTVGRELKMIELKKKLNQALASQNRD